MKTVIIIGGGIAGCSTAYALAKRGLSVKLIERHQSLAQEASGNPVAMLYPRFNVDDSLQSVLSVKGFNYTLALLRQLPADHLMYALCGQLQLAFNAREADKQTALLAASNSTTSNQNIQPLSASEASAQVNLPLTTGGLYLPNAGWVKPKVLCEALTQSAYIEKMTANEALSIKQTSSGWQISIKNEQLLAAEIVVLCNANDVQLFEQSQHVPVIPVRGQINFFPENAVSRQITGVICSDHYLSPAVDGMHSIGTSYAPNDLNPALSATDTQANLAAINKISPALFNSIDQSNVTGRVAWRSATKDYMPLAGQLIDASAIRSTPPRYNDNPSTLPWLKGLYMNAGHGSRGMITAPLCGELIANQICHETLMVGQPISSRLNPSRFLLRELGLKKMAQNLHPF